MWAKSILTITSMFLASCTILSVGDLTQLDENIYVGIVKIRSTQNDVDTQHSNITTYGAWFGDNSLGLGFLGSQTISVPPNCQITFIIENHQQLESSLALISSSLGDETEGICVTGKN